MPLIHQSYKEPFNGVIPNLKDWRTCIGLFTQDRQLRKYIQECDGLITPEQREIKFQK